MRWTHDKINYRDLIRRLKYRRRTLKDSEQWSIGYPFGGHVAQCVIYNYIYIYIFLFACIHIYHLYLPREISTLAAVERICHVNFTWHPGSLSHNCKDQEWKAWIKSKREFCVYLFSLLFEFLNNQIFLFLVFSLLYSGGV